MPNLYFVGQMLLNWLTSSIDKSHYLRLVMTKHDISVIACQMCTCLIAAGVIKQLEGKDTETVFKVREFLGYWVLVPYMFVNNNNKMLWVPVASPLHMQGREISASTTYTCLTTAFQS